MTALSAPADGALGPRAADLLDVSIPWWLAVLLFGLAFAIGHLTGRVESRVRAAEHRRTQDRRVEYAQFDADDLDLAQHPHPAMVRGETPDQYRKRLNLTRGRPQLFPAGRTPAPSDEEFAEWSKRLDDALRDAQAGTWVPIRLPEKRAVCGQPTSTSLGAVRCLARPGHPGRC